MNARGDTAACRAAAMTSSAGASLGTKARGAGLERAEELLVAGVHGEHDDAQASGWSSRAAPWHELEAAAVGQPDVEDDDVRARALDQPCERLVDGAGLADDVEVPVRSKARRRPWRISSWSSTRAPSSVTGVRSLRARPRVRLASAPPPPTSTTRPPSGPAPSDSAAPDARRPFAHDLAGRSCRAGRDPARGRRPRRRARPAGGCDPAGDPEVVGIGVLAGVGDRPPGRSAAARSRWPTGSRCGDSSS